MASIGADGPNIEAATRCQVSQLRRLPPRPRSRNDIGNYQAEARQNRTPSPARNLDLWRSNNCKVTRFHLLNSPPSGSFGSPLQRVAINAGDVRFPPRANTERAS